MSRAAFEGEALQHHEDCLLGTHAEKVPGGVDDQPLSFAGPLHAADNKGIATMQALVDEDESADAKQCHVARPNEANGKGAFVTPAKTVGECDVTAIGLVTPFNDAHMQPVPLPEPHQAVSGEDAFSDLEMVGKQFEPQRPGHSVNQEFRQRLLQQIIMRSRIFARRGEIRKKTPPAHCHDRVGSEAQPEETTALPRGPQGKGQYSTQHEIFRLREFKGGFWSCAVAESIEGLNFGPKSDPFALKHVKTCEPWFDPFARGCTFGNCTSAAARLRAPRFPELVFGRD